MQDDVGAEGERLLQVGGEGVVDDDQCADRVCRLGSGPNVDHVHERVRRGLEPDHPRLLVQMRRQVLVDLVVWHPVEDVALRLVDLREHPVDAAVDVVDRDDAVTWIDQMHQRRRRRQAGGEGNAVLGSFERGQARLERGPGWIRGPRVVVALVLANRVLKVGRRLVDRHRQGAGRRIGLLAGVDRAGLELHALDSSCGVDSACPRSAPVGDQALCFPFL